MKKAESNGPAIIIFIVVLLIFSSVIGGLVYFFWEDLFPPSEEDDKKTPSPSDTTADEPQVPLPYDLASLSPLSVVPGPSTPPPPPSGKCVGSWSTCPTCAPGDTIPTQRYTFINRGDGQCKDTDGTTIVEGRNDTKQCLNIPRCGRNCKGSWSQEWSACSSTCGFSQKTRTFTVEPGHFPTEGGLQCDDPSLGYGPLATRDGATETVNCTTNDPGYTGACTTAKDCVGSWKSAGCSSSCGGGFEQEMFVVNPGDEVQDGSDGTIGKACGNPNGDIKNTTTPCNSNKCCSGLMAGDWQAVGHICAGGNDPYIIQWSRPIIQNPEGLSDVQAKEVCNLPLFATSRSAYGPVLQGQTQNSVCNPVNPVSGTCTNQGTYSTSTGCTSKQPVMATSIACRSEQGSTSDMNISKRDLAERLRSKVVNDLGLTGAATDYSLIYDAKSNAPLDTTIDGCRVDIILQKPGMTSININKMTIQETVSSATCPTGYTRNGAKCTWPASQIDSLQCPQYFGIGTSSFRDNKCVAQVTEGSTKPTDF